MSLRLDLVSLLVPEYDPAIEFFVDVVGFELVDDYPATTNDGRAKRWVVVRPPGGGTGLLLARADGEVQAAKVGDQAASRVGFFLRVDDFEAARQRLVAAHVELIGQMRDEPYGRLQVFRDPFGNLWDLLGPAPKGRGSTSR